MDTLVLTATDAARPTSGAVSLPALAGFFLVFRVGITFLFFQSNPVLGTVANVTLGLAMVYAAVFSTQRAPEPRAGQRSAIHGWIAAYLVFSLLSLAWSGSQSALAAAGYWAALAADVAVVLVMFRGGDAPEVTERLMMGAVLGGAALALVAWASPLTDDLRLGNNEFLHPNTLGLEIGLCTLLAQYLARRGRGWNWIAAGLAITLLRTLSKTAIVAFVIAESWWFLQQRGWTRAARVRIVVAATAVITCFWGVITANLDAYSNGPGQQLETLTGRTLLWTVVMQMGSERPWFGHGFNSFKSLVPSLGDFAPVHAHNELLHQFFELGVVGLVIVIGIYTAFLLRASRALPGELRTLSISVWIFAVVRGLADAVPSELCFPLWLMAALTVCLERTREVSGQ